MQEVESTLPMGTVVGDRYVIEDLLGKGGFGAVYLVRDQRVRHNLFALKELIDPNKRERDRFAFECEVLRRLDHPALPHVYRVFKDDLRDRSYMLMDYVEGPNLDKLRQQQPDKRLSLPQVLTIMAPIMNAISYLHSQHPPIIHRDIKPANIIVPASGDETVLVDFGIAKEYNPDATTTAVRHCSPGYGAPEQYGIGTNTRTDIYGLGATVYTLLTGVVPADAFYRMTKLGGKGIDPLEQVNRLAPNISPHIALAIHRAMSIDSNERFPTVQDFRQALNAHPSSQYSTAMSIQDSLPVFLPVTARRPVVVTRPRPMSSPDALAAEGFPLVTTANTPQATALTPSRRKLGALLLILLVLLIGLASVIALIFTVARPHPTTTTPQSSPTVIHLATLTPASTLTPQPSSSRNPGPSTSPAPVIPALVLAYSGNIHNNAGIDTWMTLTSIVQNSSKFSGYFTVGPLLLGNGAFNGIVEAHGHIQFTVEGYQGNAPLFFYGSVLSNGNLAGHYCSLDKTGQCNSSAGGAGIWNVVPESPGSGSSLPQANTP